MSERWACIARLGGIGDNLIAASTLRPLKRLGYKTEVITSPSAGAVYLHNPFLDKLTVKADGDIKGNWQEWFALRAKEYDIFANLSHSCERRHALNVNDTAFWWRQDYRRKFCAGSYLESAHDIVGVPYDFGPLYHPTEEERARASRTRDEQIENRYVTWVISGSRVDKVYPWASMVIPRIIKELGVSVLLVGAGPKQFEYAKQIETDVRRSNSALKGLHLAMTPETGTVSPDGRAMDKGGTMDWSLRRSLAQVLASDVVISPDTGMAWAVAFEPMPKIIMVSHASAENITKHWVNTVTLTPDKNRVPCWPCHRLHDTIDTCVPNKDGGQAAACISDTSVEKLIERTRDALAK
jgi:ADP-heptose:LPS heptosyltransferase